MDGGSSWSQLIFLSIRVQIDAFKLNPLGYLQGWAWRIRGLKVRSKNRISALSGRSPKAYALWIRRTEPKLFAAIAQVTVATSNTIRPVIDCRQSLAGLNVTLASLSEAGCHAEAILIGGTGTVEGLHIEQPRELATLIEGGGHWVMPLICGDTVAPVTSDAYLHAIGVHSRETSIIYADDDVIGKDGERSNPHFKPDWNPDLFQWHDYITGSAIVWAEPSMLKKLPSTKWAEWLVHEQVKDGRKPLHLPFVLHHRSDRPAPERPLKPPFLGLDALPEVTAIIPTRNHADLLEECLAGIARARYPRVKTLIVDNGSDDPTTLALLASQEATGVQVLRRPGPFNYSALNNAAVAKSQSELLCFLNNDVEMIDNDWLALLARQAMRPEIGAVGARLLYPDHTIQHAGVVIGIGGGAGHAHRFQPASASGYFSRAHLPQQVSAVTAACLVVGRDKFLAVGGFDEVDFPVAFNDVDLCLKLNARGWQSFYEPRATLIHHESKSRGSDSAVANRERFSGELAALKRKWHTDERRDPFHHPQLSTFCEQFLVAV